jgi:hypothetical protein
LVPFVVILMLLPSRSIFKELNGTATYLSQMPLKPQTMSST